MTIDSVIYFGRPGSLIQLKQPRGGVDSTRARPTATFTTGTGGARVGKVTGGSRRYTLSWTSLDYETYATLLGYDQGHEGPGPFALLDPGQRNQLTVNQSSATSHLCDTDNFTVSGSGYTISSDATVYRRGPRSLKVTVAYASQAGTLSLDPPSSNWYGVPVASRPMVFSYYAKGAGSDPAVILTPKLTWYDTSGATVSTTSGNATATTSAAWTQMYVTATTPATAAYVGCSVATSAGSIGAASVLYFDQLQLEEGSTPSDWRPGTGVMPVKVVSVSERWGFYNHAYRQAPVMVVQESGV